MLVHIVADYGQGDLAFAEVVQRLKFYLPDAEAVLTPVPPFCTLAAGFCIAQLALNPAPPGTIIYHNVAPREDDDAAQHQMRIRMLGLLMLELRDHVLVVEDRPGDQMRKIRHEQSV